MIREGRGTSIQSRVSGQNVAPQLLKPESLQSVENPPARAGCVCVCVCVCLFLCFLLPLRPKRLWGTHWNFPHRGSGL